MPGRSAQASRIASLIGGNCNVALHAPPGVGKTWLADRVIQEAGGESARLVRIDLSTHSNAAAVFCSIQKSISGRHTPAEDVHSAWRVLREALIDRSTAIAVVLDEFDEVLKYPDALEFLKLLRELVHRPAITHCAVLILSRRPLETVESEIRGISTLATVCYPEYLGAVTACDLREVWNLPDEMDDDDLQKCVEWSGGYAPLVRYWLATRSAGIDAAQGETQQVIEFGRLVDHLEATNLLSAAAQLTIGPVVDDWLREARQLSALGVLSEGGYASHDVFVACLRRRTVTLDPWGPLGSAELRLRGVIEAVFLAEMGSDWAQKLAKTSRSVARALEESAKKQDVDSRRFGRSAEWLAYTYPQDLGDIIISNWSYFTQVFSPGNKQQWRERFETLAQYRTPVAHNRAEVLSEAQRLQCKAYADEVLRAIDRWRRDD